jgi:hypothetical protein
LKACSRELAPCRFEACPGSMDINNSRRGVHIKLSLSEAKNDLDCAEVFLVEHQILFKFTPEWQSELAAWGVLASGKLTLQPPQSEVCLSAKLSMLQNALVELYQPVASCEPRADIACTA